MFHRRKEININSQNTRSFLFSYSIAFTIGHWLLCLFLQLVCDAYVLITIGLLSTDSVTYWYEYNQSSSHTLYIPKSILLSYHITHHLCVLGQAYEWINTRTILALIPSSSIQYQYPMNNWTKRTFLDQLLIDSGPI